MKKDITKEHEYKLTFIVESSAFLWSLRHQKDRIRLGYLLDDFFISTNEQKEILLVSMFEEEEQNKSEKLV